MAGEFGSFVAEAFHQAAVTNHNVGFIVEGLATGGRHLLGQGHAHGVGEALAEGASGGLNAGHVTIFRVAGGGGVQLAEVFEAVEGNVITRQVQQGVLEHGAVAVGEHKTVAVGPVGGGRVKAQKLGKKDGGDVGHTHGHTGVAALGGFYSVNSEKA